MEHKASASEGEDAKTGSPVDRGRDVFSLGRQSYRRYEGGG